MPAKILAPFYEKKDMLNGVFSPLSCFIADVEQHSEETVRPHHHEYIEILYCLRGECDVYVNGNIRALRTGDLLIVNSGENHVVLFDRSGAEYAVIKVMPDILHSQGHFLFEVGYTMPFLIENAPHQRHFTWEEQSGPIIRDTVIRIVEEWLAKKYGYELSIRADLMQIFLWVLRYWRDHNLEMLEQFDFPDSILRTVQTALDYISQNYANITAEEVAKHCNLSYSYFSRLFKKVMHQSFTEYLNLYRINKAEQLLCSKELSVNEVASAVGFSDTSYFIQKFKSAKGISPKQFQNKFLPKI